jgi:hypothetical protein
MQHDTYTCEERNLCAHLFRLLHEPANSYAALRAFTGWKQGDMPWFRVFLEVLLVRDVYTERVQDRDQFMDNLVNAVAMTGGLSNYTHFLKLPQVLRTSQQTHPWQIAMKMRRIGFQPKRDDFKVYSFLQPLFTTGPMLVVCLPGELLLYKVKASGAFDEEQYKRLHRIGAIWREVLYADLGYDAPPGVKIVRLGPGCVAGCDVSWEQVFSIAQEIYPHDDNSCRIFSSVAGICEAA